MKNKKHSLKICKMSAAVIVSALFQSFSITSFSIPGKLYPSGVTGFSRLLSDILADFFTIDIPFNVFYLAINLCLAIFVFKHIGKLFTIFSLIQTILVTIIVNYLPPMINIQDILLLSVFGGIFNGIGSGIALKEDASTGGTDFISIYLANKYNKSMWNFIFGLNVCIIIIAGFIYGWEIALYSIIFQFCSTQVVNGMHNHFTFKSLNIITKNPEAVTDEILANTRHGITEIKALGAFKKEDVYLLYTVINTYQCQEVIDSALKADPHCFISIQDTKTIIGNYYQKPLD